MASASGLSLLTDGPVCSICLDVFTLPRQLPCMHSFCQKCLHGYISKTVGIKGEVVEEFVCPVCRAITNAQKTEKPIGVWASRYPRSAISVTAGSKVKVENYCDDCQYVDEFNTAQWFCVVCEESLCNACLTAHKKTKVTRDHKVISIEELNSTPENQIRFAEGFGCPDHQDKRIEYYCQSHEAVCCADCFFSYHRTCDQVKSLSKDLPSLLSDLMPEEIMEQIKTIEKHLETFILTNDLNISKLEATVNNLTYEVRAFRKTINERLDEIERIVKTEGSRIYKEEMIRRQEENNRCQCLINAVRNSHIFLESVMKYGTDTQKFLVSKKSIEQLKSYKGQIREKYEEIESVLVYVEFSGLVKEIISQDVNGIARLLSKGGRTCFPCLGISDDHFYISTSRPPRERQVKLVIVVDIHFRHNGSPYYSGAVQLPGGDLMLADTNNNTCCLYNSFYNFITSYKLPEGPLDMCLIGDSEVSVTLPDMKTIQFLSIRDHSIRDTGTTKTVYLCSSIAAISRDDVVVTGPTDDRKKCYWSLVSRTAGERRHHEFDCPGVCWTHVTLNNSKSRVYRSEYQSNAVSSFDLTNGRMYFVYTSNYLTSPLGIAVDWKDNVYVVGYNSHNIHKLSPEGATLQVITSAVLQHPLRIFFNRSSGHFIISNNNPGQRNKLHLFIQQ